MTVDAKAGRHSQKSRTRRDLLRATARLVKDGRKPTLEEIAEEALVSRATAYRYFPNVEALLSEASFDLAVPEAETLFRNDASTDPVARLTRVDTALHDMILANEASLRLMLAHALQCGLASEQDSDLPKRQNRRTPLIEAALAPARKEFKPASLATLSKALALILGPEAVMVFKDVLQADDAEARRVKKWAIRALVDAARKSP
jgi:AcrR family transcriptional regulator